MIKAKKNNLTIKGNAIDLMSQWIVIGRAIYKCFKAQLGDENAEKLMRKNIENVFKSEKEIVEKAMEIIRRKQEKESEESANE